MASTIQLTLVNRSNDANNSQVVIFQQNVATNMGELIVPWQVVRNLGRDWTYSFEYPLDLTVGVTDSYGNTSPQMSAQPGQLWQVSTDTAGDELSLLGQSPGTSEEIQVLNNLGRGAISANAYRKGKLLATKTNVAPGQKASFLFKPSIYIGVVSQIQIATGQPVDSAILSNINQQLSLVGVTSGTIIMTGGGPGQGSSPFTFDLTTS